MEQLLLGYALVFVVGLLLYNRWRLKHRPQPIGDVPDPVFEHQTRLGLEQLQKKYPTFQALPPEMLPHHGYPDADQWLILLEYAPAEAQAILQKLREHTNIRGRASYIAAITSQSHYAAVQLFLAAEAAKRKDTDAPHEQPPAQAITYLAYPDQQQWAQLLQHDQQSALRFYHRILLQDAYLGLEGPVIIEESIADFQRAREAQPET